MRRRRCRRPARRRGAPDDGASGACAAIPSETAGPYPGDGTNGPNALALSGIERTDLRTSLAPASGIADGVDLTVALTLVSASTCAPLAGYVVYLWHCDRAGDYSMYTGNAVGESYLRGVQIADASGQLAFQTIFPGCYAGRWPHIHFEIYASLAQATSGAARRAVSQLALPRATCDLAYATAGYEQSVSNLSKISLATDLVFQDGATCRSPRSRAQSARASPPRRRSPSRRSADGRHRGVAPTVAIAA